MSSGSGELNLKIEGGMRAAHKTPAPKANGRITWLPSAMTGQEWPTPPIAELKRLACS